MKAIDSEQVIEKALCKTELTKESRPRLLSDNGPCFRSSEFKEYLQTEGMYQVFGAPYHPQTQGKIERFHRTMKNVIKLENYYIPEQLRSSIEAFVDYYNNCRYHESLDNLTPADVYFGRAENILKMRRETKRRTIEIRRKKYFKQKLSDYISIEN